MSSEMQMTWEATEMWFIWRMLRLQWTARRLNSELSDMDGGDLEKPSHDNAKIKTEVHGSCIKGKQLGEGLSTCYHTKNKGAWKTENKVYGRFQDVVEVIRLAQNRGEGRKFVSNINFDTTPR